MLVGHLALQVTLVRWGGGKVTQSEQTVIARTKREVDKALAGKAQNVVIEGSDELLAYAEARVDSKNAPSIEATISPVAASRPAPAMRMAMLLPALAAFGLGVTIWSYRPAATSNPSNVPPIVEASREHKDVPFPSDPMMAEASNPYFDISQYMPLVWAIIALVALVFMYLITRQAIAGGSNVSIEWRVTEKVQGKLKITRGSRSASNPQE